MSAELHQNIIQYTSWLMKACKSYRIGDRKSSLASWCEVYLKYSGNFFSVVSFRLWDFNRRTFKKICECIAWCMLIFMCCNVMCNYHDHFLNLLIFFPCAWHYLLCCKRNLSKVGIIKMFIVLHCLLHIQAIMSCKHKKQQCFMLISSNMLIRSIQYWRKILP